MKTTPTYTNVELIAIVDPRPIFKKGFTAALMETRQALKIIEVSTCQELEKRFADQAPEIIFMSGSGFSDIEIINLASRLRRYWPLACIAVYDNRKSVDFLLTFFRDSIGGYLPEDFDARELDVCINSLALGLHYLNSEIAYQLIVQKPARKEERRTSILSGLEKKVAGCLIKGMTTSEIAHALDRRSSTISTVKSNIYRKTDVHNIIDLAKILKRQDASLEAFERN